MNEVHAMYGILILGAISDIVSIGLASLASSRILDYRYALIHDDFYGTKTKNTR
jgi:hypothetical protein